MKKTRVASRTVAIATAMFACATLQAQVVQQRQPMQPAQQAPTASRSQYPPTGTMVDVGGYRVHLNCTGAGRPTVVILGAGYSFDWSLVQVPVSASTRVCTSDPAGSAWSDPAPTPVTCDGRVSEIHRMLQNGGVDGPIILVGHSIGAVFARMYAERYPADVAGMVVSDHAGRYLMSPAAASPFGTAPVIRSGEQSVQKLPPTTQALHHWAVALPHESSIPFFNRCIAQLDTSKARRAGALGDRPLIVIGNTTLAASDDYRKKETEFLALSRHSSSMTAATAGHDAPLDDPETIVRAIRMVLGEIRKR